MGAIEQKEFWTQLTYDIEAERTKRSPLSDSRICGEWAACDGFPYTVTRAGKQGLVWLEMPDGTRERIGYVTNQGKEFEMRMLSQTANGPELQTYTGRMNIGWNTIMWSHPRMSQR